MVGSVIQQLHGAYASFDENEKGSIQQGKLADLRLPFLISKETPKAFGDDLGNLRRHHFVPAFVSSGDALEHVARKYRQIFGIIVIKLHEAATADEIVVQRLLAGAGRWFWFG